MFSNLSPETRRVSLGLAVVLAALWIVVYFAAKTGARAGHIEARESVLHFGKRRRGLKVMRDESAPGDPPLPPVVS